MLTRIQVRESEVEAGNQRYQRLTEELERRVQQRTAELEVDEQGARGVHLLGLARPARAAAAHRRVRQAAGRRVRRATLPDEARHYLGRVRDGARQMGLLVDDLLNLARLGRQDVKLQVAGLSSIVAARHQRRCSATPRAATSTGRSSRCRSSSATRR